jgi:tRNA modification GTPase
VFSTTDTIVAIATPPGRGGLGVVRVSGPDACRIARALLRREAPLEPRYATFGRIAEGTGADTRVLDEVVVTWFESPRSYTTEDVVEIAAHGSPVLLARIVQLAMAAGARLAEPGEFTLRAYLHGRLDLVQAEAVADLIDAVTPLQARAAMDQLEGTLTSSVKAIDAALFDLAARLEASLDFPDEGFHFITRGETAAALADIREGLAALARDGRAGRLIREGGLVVIGGRPNAGKSSLFNALAGASRAIVTDVPGTTRDVLTERVDVGGVPLTLVDTAGLRRTDDVIEAEGVGRARQAMAIAALRLLVVDRSRPIDEDDRVEAPAERSILVRSKSDLPRDPSWPAIEEWSVPSVDVSVVTGEGLDRLRALILDALADRDDWRDTPVISNVRHLKHVQRALEALDRARASLDAGATEELALAELAAARQALEELTGRRTADDLLERIFSRFCVGK